MLCIADNRGNIIAPLTVRPVNVYDTKLFDSSFTNLLDIAYYLELDIKNSYLTLDSGFDSAENRIEIEKAEMNPAIKPNLRGLKNQEKINQRLDEFKIIESVYKERYKIEKCFAWEDKYRKLVIRYERLQCIFMGFRYLAYSMINFRSLFGGKLC